MINLIVSGIVKGIQDITLLELRQHEDDDLGRGVGRILKMAGRAGIASVYTAFGVEEINA
jgi:hypothetical protein